jgi:hypothetical protein
MGQPRQYDPGQVIVNFKGVDISGFAEGTFVNAQREKEAFTKAVGADGAVTRVRSRDRSGMVTVTLQAASPVNDVLSSIAISDEIFGDGVGPLLVKDLLGNTLVDAESAWIRKVPDIEFGDEASSREWAFDCAELTIKVGGNVIA